MPDKTKNPEIGKRKAGKKRNSETKSIALYIGNAFQIDISLSINKETLPTGQSG